MKLAKRIGQLVCVFCFLIDWGCGKKTSNGLGISANPNRPILITSGSTINGSVTGPTPPYFYINSLTVTWSGGNQFELLALTLYAGSLTSSSTSSSGSTTATPFSCGGSGSAVTAIFAGSTITDSPPNCSGIPAGTSALDFNQNLTLPPQLPAGQKPYSPLTNGCTLTVVSAGFFCDSVPVAVNPNPFASYNVPVQVIIFGEGMDATGNVTGRVNGVGNITIQ